MDIGIYLRDINKYKEVIKFIPKKIGWIVCGDYGCPKIIPDTSELIRFKKLLSQNHIGLHYISPKINLKYIDEEASRIILLINEKISVSINDWGLLYRIRPFIKTDHSVYLGRLLTKSIANWAWGSIFLSKESKETAEYFSQCNFQQKEKINLLKLWGVKGIEVNVEPLSEKSFEKIKSQGLEVIGYSDKKILSVARACPIARLHGVNVSLSVCNHLCTKSFMVISAQENQQKVFPKMELIGNVLYQNVNSQSSWNGYQKIIYYN